MEETLFISEPVLENETDAEELQALTIESFEIGTFAGIGMICGGSALIISLLVLGVLSILRTR